MLVQVLLLLMLSGPCAAAVPPGARQSLPPGLELVKVLEIDSSGADRTGLNQAVDIARADDALLYLGGGLNRLDLKTGRIETLISRETLNGGEVIGESNTLLATSDSNRVIVMTGGLWNCPWSVFLITVEPFSARRLTEDACGNLALSPATDYLAVVASNVCEGRACGDGRLHLLSTKTGLPVFVGKMPENYSDLYWDSKRSITVRYDEDAQPGSLQPVRRWVVRLTEGSSGWQWGNPEAAGTSRPLDIGVDHNASVKVKMREGSASVSFKADAVFGEPPTGYRSDTPRVFRVNERVVIVRRLWEKDPEPGNNPRSRDQIALIRVKSAG